MIRELKADELKLITPMGEEFFTKYHHRKFNEESFIKNCANLMKRGAVWIEERDSKVIGSIGAVIHPDFCSEDLVALSLFWFVNPEYRGKAGLTLFHVFVDWAKDNGAKILRTTCLLNEQTSSLRKFYMRNGCIPIEISFGKILWD